MLKKLNSGRRNFLKMAGVSGLLSVLHPKFTVAGEESTPSASTRKIRRSAKQPVINIHTHIVKEWDLDETVRDWRKNGALKCCVLALAKESHSYDNDMLLGAMKKYPDLIAGHGFVKSTYPYDTAKKIEQFKDQGFVGLKFTKPDAPYSDERFFPIYEKAEELGMPIVFHTGMVDINVSKNTYTDWMRPITLDRIARAFPDLKLIGGHIGDPYFDESFKVIKRFPNVYLTPCGARGSNFHISKCKKALAPFPGANWDNPDENTALVFFKKFCFATDTATIPHWFKQSVDLMDYLHIGEETRQLYWWKNAADIYGWKF